MLAISGPYDCGFFTAMTGDPAMPLISGTTEAALRLPLFHKNIVPLDPLRHGALKLDRSTGHGYAAAAEIVPIGLGEFDAAAQSYPILFAGEPQPIAVVVLGIAKGWNLFVNAEGVWMPGANVPALVRAYPFVFIAEAGGGSLALGIEADAVCLGAETGLPLFEDGKPTAGLSEAVSLCQACEQSLADAAGFAAALDEAGVLVPKEATIEAKTGGTARIAGFKTVDPERLAAVPDAVFLDWRRRHWLPPLFAHLFSAANWLPFTDLAINALATRQ
jgi:SapC